MYSAYAQISETRFLEIYGLNFEEFAEGQVFHHRPGMTVSQQENAEEAFDTFNCAMLHYDEHYAAQTEFKKPLVVSTLTLQKIFGMSWKTFARKDRITAFENISMTGPIFGGDTLYCTSQIIKTDNTSGKTGDVTVKASCTNQNGVEVANLTYTVNIFKKGQHPVWGNQPNTCSNPWFLAYHQREDGSLQEATGIFFEGFAKGQIFEHSPEITLHPSSMLRHAVQTMQWHPLYNDREFARDIYGRDRLPASELHVLSLITAATTSTFGRVVANLGWTDTKLSRHFYAEDRFKVTSEVLATRESRSRPDQGILTVKTVAQDQTAQEALSYIRTLLIYREGKGPYAAAGY
ncbi:MaoC family dehydratase [Pseudovibrio sp. JE062]|uniref:MaoC family dehydratase n=1 Tax=Pseudovibrio sp. JE062 TaxID=439495 RepID=UPI000186BC47|nr:MaoC family dehydratase [Pseudovibrio sp. JE062]EEA96833.1 MaoC like domain protein [Pseudovibrio sp. JE062]